MFHNVACDFPYISYCCPRRYLWQIARYKYGMRDGHIDWLASPKIWFEFYSFIIFCYNDGSMHRCLAQVEDYLTVLRISYDYKKAIININYAT